MAADDLDVPLGTDKKKRKGLTLPVAMPQLVVGALSLSVVAVAIWAMLVDDPFGGEPIAIVATHAAPSTGAKDENTAAAPGTGRATATIIAAKAGEAATVLPPGAKTITIIDGSSGKKQDVVIPGKSGAVSDAKLQMADPRLLEQSRHGAIP